MPISGRWQDAEHTTYELTFSGRWTVENYQQQFDEATRQLESVPHPVDVVLDLAQSAPPPLQIFNHAGALLERRAANLRYVAVIVTSTIVRNLVGLGVRANPVPALKLDVFPTRQEALRAVQGVRLAAERKLVEEERNRTR